MALVYSCCFWFSLRLGGILIGIFSIAVLILTLCCLGYTHSQLVKDEIQDLTNGLNLIYAKNYLESIQQDLQNVFSLGISFTCIYIIVCLMFMYGAYTCNNMLMITYILMELLRLILLSVLVATCLLLIKQNTMDIGMLIGASVAGGFLLLGMFYLWICAANLPIVVNEIEREEQAVVINRLQQLLDKNNARALNHDLDVIPFKIEPRNTFNQGILTHPKYKDINVQDRLKSNFKTHKPFINNLH